jgi:hypothetical protein
VALLGHRPTEPTAVTDWNRRAQAVEYYRHHILGLPYGAPASASGGTPAELALGPQPTEPAQRILYERLLAHQATLDLDMTG